MFKKWGPKQGGGGIFTPPPHVFSSLKIIQFHQYPNPKYPTRQSKEKQAFWKLQTRSLYLFSPTCILVPCMSHFYSKDISIVEWYDIQEAEISYQSKYPLYDNLMVL